MLEDVETTPVEALIEGNVRRLTRKSGFPARLQNYDLFQDNEVNNDGDFFHFSLMAESKHVKMEEALSDAKWICGIQLSCPLIPFWCISRF